MIEAIPRSDQIDQLARTVAYLSVRLEIADCLNCYCRGLDRLDADLLRSCFHPDAIDHHGDFRGGVDLFVPWAIEIEGRYARTHHNITTQNCEIDGDVAHVESYVTWFVVEGERRILAGGGRYVDRFEARGGAWRIAARQLILDWRLQGEGDMAVGTQGYPAGARDGSDPSYARPFILPDIGYRS